MSDTPTILPITDEMVERWKARHHELLAHLGYKPPTFGNTAGLVSWADACWLMMRAAEAALALPEIASGMVDMRESQNQDAMVAIRTYEAMARACEREGKLATAAIWQSNADQARAKFTIPVREFKQEE